MGLTSELKNHDPYLLSGWVLNLMGRGLRYEIALEIESGHIVWAYGGFHCGRYPDLKIARRRFVKLLKPNEKTITDKGYRYDNHFIIAKMVVETTNGLKKSLLNMKM